ncbi:helix-turn-helix domain-containing protein [Virgibacillus oceani]
MVITMNDKKTSNEFGEFIKEFRTKEKKMNLRDFADLIGISFSHLSKIERGEHIPSKTTVGMIAESLDIDKDRLFLMAGYASENFASGLDVLFPKIDEEETARKAAIIDKIKIEFPDADLMFNDLASFTADDMEDVYNYIKFKKSQKENERGN